MSIFHSLIDNRYSSMIESGDTAAAEIMYSDTNTGSMATPTRSMMPATGKKVALTGAFIINVRGDKITSFHESYDQLSMAQQLGPAPI
jgi:predicted ester cyclase